MSIPVLMYHQIDVTPPRGTRLRGLTVHPSSFRRQMVWMKRLGYQGLGMSDLMPYLRGDRQGKVFGITFDDGYCNVLRNALPVLGEVGFTSTNYFVASHFGEGNFWDADKGIPHSALMTLDEARAWIAGGQEAGSHTLDHARLSAIGADAAREQIFRSRDVLQDALHVPVTAFCYPYGDFNASHAQMAREAGYTNATTTGRGLAGPSDDLFLLPRVGIWRTTHMIRFFQKCLTGHEDRRRG